MKKGDKFYYLINGKRPSFHYLVISVDKLHLRMDKYIGEERIERSMYAQYLIKDFDRALQKGKIEFI